MDVGDLLDPLGPMTLALDTPACVVHSATDEHIITLTATPFAAHLLSL